MQKDDKVYLMHIRDCINNIQTYIVDYTQETFLADQKTKDAVVRNFEIIGEATKKINADYRAENEDIPWKEMAGLRDVLIHDYMGVDWWRVWEIANNNIPDLKKKIETILNAK